MALPMDLGTVVTRGPDVRSLIGRPRDHPMASVNRPDPSLQCTEPVQAAGGGTHCAGDRNDLLAPQCGAGSAGTVMTRRSAARSRLRRGISLTTLLVDGAGSVVRGSTQGISLTTLPVDGAGSVGRGSTQWTTGPS